MNEQRSSLTGVCIQQQSSEQRSLTIDQQKRDKISNPDGSASASSVPQTFIFTASAGTVVRSGGMSGGVASQPPQLHRSLLNNGGPYSSYVLKDELNRENCVCVPSSACSVTSDEKPCLNSVSIATAVPSTSTAEVSPIKEKLSVRKRQKCSFKLPASEAYRLRRIAEAQPIALKSIGIASVQIDDSGPISIIVSTPSLDFPETSYTTVVGTTNSLTSVSSLNSSGDGGKRSIDNLQKIEKR